ncbi:MAG: hypothetical protein R3B70_19535 [Polyangiaceae bacterium]
MKGISAAAIALLFAVPAAAADPPPPRVRLSYSAPGACPDEPAFVAAVTSQARPFTRAPRSSARIRLLEASIVPEGGGFHGTLRVREADGASSTREVRGDTCAEVSSALALVAAITIDTGPPEPQRRPPPPPPPPEKRPPPAPPARWSFDSAVSGGAFFGVAPGPAWGIAPAFEMTPPLSVPLTFQLGAILAASPRAETATGSAEFLWFSGRLGASIAAVRAGPFALEGAAGFGAGFLRGKGISIRTPREQARPWVDAGLGARARVELLSWFGLDVGAGVLLPITQDMWVFDNPEVVIHSTPDIGAYVTLGVRFALSR